MCDCPLPPFLILVGAPLPFPIQPSKLVSTPEFKGEMQNMSEKTNMQHTQQTKPSKRMQMLTNLISLRGWAACRALFASFMRFICAWVYFITVGCKVPAIPHLPWNCNLSHAWIIQLPLASLKLINSTDGEKSLPLSKHSLDCHAFDTTKDDLWNSTKPLKKAPICCCQSQCGAIFLSVFQIFGMWAQF